MLSNLKINIVTEKQHALSVVFVGKLMYIKCQHKSITYNESRDVADKMDDVTSIYWDIYI